MESKWSLGRVSEKIKPMLADLVEKNYKEFLEKSVRVKIPHGKKRDQGHFRFLDVYSYNYAEIQKKYKVEEVANASLIEHTRDFIAMEYPTEEGVEAVSELVKSTKTKIIISLIGERYHWESDFLREGYMKIRKYSISEFVEYMKKSSFDIAVLKYNHALDILKEQNENFTIEVHTAKEAKEAEKQEGRLRDREKTCDKNIEHAEKKEECDILESSKLFRINCLCWKDKTPPDINVIKALDILYEMCAYITESRKKEKEPTIVHCLAGVGRTGSFIFYHMMRNAILEGEVTEENKLSAFIDLFIYLRSKRTWMVQAPKQLDFLYNIFIRSSTAMY